MTSPIDTDVRNYTIPELFSILQVEENDSPSLANEIQVASQRLIDKFKRENNSEMETFFKDIQSTLLEYLSVKSIEKQTQNWIKNEYMTQDNEIQNQKITNRNDQIDVYQDEHAPMTRQRIGINNTFQVPVSQDSLNPNLKNTIEYFINLDSQYRQTGTLNTDYTCDLSDHLKDVLDLRLFSFQIPFTWYIVDTAYGNTCFWVTDGAVSIPITIAPGNYNSTTMVTALTQAALVAGFTNLSANVFSYSNINGKITINLLGAQYTGPNPANPSETITIYVSSNTLLTFFDPTAQLQCQTNCVDKTFYINQTLGWLLGFRLPYVNVLSTGNTGEAILDLNGPKYLILVIDDYNQNHINNGLVSITELSTTLKMPNYYSPDLPYVCVTPSSNLSANMQTIATSNISQDDSGEILMEKLNYSYKTYPQLVPSAPRTLTQSQLYTINEIIKNNDKNTNYRLKAPTTPDVFAVIPVKGGLTFGSMYVELSGSLQDFKRTYFGPVNIDRLRVVLQDDKGNVLNLNGADWSISLIATNLYQY